jgi:hypothetical protein
MSAKTTEKTETSTEMTQPVIIDLGRQKSAAIKALKEGEGELWDEVFDVVDEVKDMLGKDADGKLLVPVVLIYEKRQSQSLALEKILFPLLNRDEDDNESDDEEE